MGTITISCADREQGCYFEEVIDFNNKVTIGSGHFSASREYSPRRLEGLVYVLHYLFDPTVIKHGGVLVRLNGAVARIPDPSELPIATENLKKRLKKLPYLWPSAAKEQNKVTVRMSIDYRVTVSIRDSSRKRELRISALMATAQIFRLYDPSTYPLSEQSVKLLKLYEQLNPFLDTASSALSSSSSSSSTGKIKPPIKNVRCALTRWLKPDSYCGPVIFESITSSDPLNSVMVKMDFNRRITFKKEWLWMSKTHSSASLKALVCLFTIFDKNIVEGPFQSLIRLNVARSQESLDKFFNDPLAIKQAQKHKRNSVLREFRSLWPLKEEEVTVTIRPPLPKTSLSDLIITISHNSECIRFSGLMEQEKIVNLMSSSFKEPFALTKASIDALTYQPPTPVIRSSSSTSSTGSGLSSSSAGPMSTSSVTDLPTAFKTLQGFFSSSRTDARPTADKPVAASPTPFPASSSANNFINHNRES